MARMSMADKMAKAVKPLDETPVEEPVGEQATQLHLVETPAPEAEAVVETAGEEQPAAASPAKTSAPAKRARRNAATATRPAAQPVAEEVASAGLEVAIDPDLDKRFRAYRQQTRTAYHHIILDAVEQTHARLPELVAKALGREEAPRTAGSLFQRTTAAALVGAEGRQDRELHTIRTTLTNRNLLDQIATDVGAPSRNFMISVALDAYLPGKASD